MDEGRGPATVKQHAERIRELLEPVLSRGGADTVPLADALARVTAVDVVTPLDLPLFRNSQMDGFAVRSADLADLPAVLPIVGDQPAGAPAPEPLAPGTARRIMTGAVVPDGADCIVPVEDTDAVFRPVASDADALTDQNGPRTVTIRVSRSPGEFVRDRGSDVRAGDVLVPAFVRLAPRHLAALAAAGIETVCVRRRPRIAIITTGAELGATGSTPPGHGRIFDSNAVALRAAVSENGCETVFADVSGDVPAELIRALDGAVAAKADLIITSGGISAGAFEVVRDVLVPLGGLIGTVAMQPGGPQGTAIYRNVPVVAFPGNPVSTQISFAVFLAPFLREDAGLERLTPSIHRLRSAIASVPGKRQFLRGRWDGDHAALPEERWVDLVSGPSSHLVAGMARADVLIDVPAEIIDLPAGSSVRVWEL
jgi:molybdopterin molybdotransferase